MSINIEDDDDEIPPFFWDHLLLRVSGTATGRHTFPPLPLAIKCSHGIESITNPTEEILDAMSSSDIAEIMQFMPAFHNSLKSRFPSASNVLNQDDSIQDICQEVIKSIMDPSNPNILPDMSDPIYVRVVNACLSALGTEYLLHARVNINQKKRYTAMAAVIAGVVAIFTQDVEVVLMLDYAQNKEELEDIVALVLNKENTCSCLKNEEEGESKCENICAYCKQSKEKLLQCAGCQSIKYCGKTCQRSDWANHKSVCKGKKKSAK